MNNFNGYSLTTLRIMELQRLMKLSHTRLEKKKHLSELVKILQRKHGVDDEVARAIKGIEQNKLEKGLH